MSTMESTERAQSAVRSLSTILPSLPSSVLSSETPSHSLLHDPAIGHAISARLRHPTSGVGDDNLCRWLYNTFQSADPDLQLIVLRSIPALLGTYLSRATSRTPLPGFEAILLAIYAHETKARGGQPQIVNIPDMGSPSLYHEALKSQGKNKAVDLNRAVVSASLEPHGTMRSTRRAMIAGVVLELYYSKITDMPVCSKVEFCRFSVSWAGQNGCGEEEEEEEEEEEDDGHDGKEESGGDGDGGGYGSRIPLPWALFQPIMRIMGHCLLGPGQPEELKRRAVAATRCLYARAMHDMNSQGILATRSLLRSRKMAEGVSDLGFLYDVGDVADQTATPTAIM